MLVTGDKAVSFFLDIGPNKFKAFFLGITSSIETLNCLMREMFKVFTNFEKMFYGHQLLDLSNL